MGPAGPKLGAQRLLEFCVRATSQTVLIPGVEQCFGRSGWEKLGGRPGRHPVAWFDEGILWGYAPENLVLMQKNARAAGNRAHANLAIGLSSTVAANLVANNVGGRAASSLAPLTATTVIFPHGCASHTSFQQTWQHAAPNCIGSERALVKREEGRGPAPNTGLRPSGPQQNTGRHGTESAPRLAWGRLGRSSARNCC